MGLFLQNHVTVHSVSGGNITEQKHGKRLDYDNFFLELLMLPLLANS